MRKELFEAFQIRGLSIENRICVPPMVCFHWTDESGCVSSRHVEHYRTVAKGGPGLIIQEATCVSRGGRLAMSQLGIWEDRQTEGHRMITEAVHKEGVPVIIQLHHGGMVGVEGIQPGPSAYSCSFNGREIEASELSVEEILQIKQDFADAAYRAYKAGYDGVELHGCHSYLISQFLNKRVNKRKDDYGKPLKFVLDILEEVRKATPSGFIVGIRLGGFEPGLEDAVYHSVELERAGIDFLDISYGFQPEQEIAFPEGWKLADIHYAAKVIKSKVSIPVFTVFGIDSREKAEEVLAETKADMIAVGRGVLINPDWARDAKEGLDVGKCLHCRVCRMRTDYKCAGRQLLEKKRKLRQGS